MEIPYTVTPRPDTGLANPKLGIWLFLASEVMLFGGLFSAYIFLRMGAEEGYWPHGLLNVPVGAMNTAILILFDESPEMLELLRPLVGEFHDQEDRAAKDRDAHP